MDFETFTKLYNFVRVRLNRADDLFVEAITKSEVSEEAEGNDDKKYILRTSKEDGLVTVAVLYPTGFRVVVAGTDLRTREVVVSEQNMDTFAILDLFENENLNGLETMALYNAKFPRENPLDQYEEDRSYAEKAARLIVAGIGEVPTLTPEQQTLVANEIIAILKDPAPFGFAARVQRTIAWAMRSDTQPEWGFYVASWVMRTHPEHVEVPHREVFAHFSPVGQHVARA
ncbi:MAG: hypothetical protein EOP83_34225 [Verrucomicrobiaceae bacterium]|nr:MAG: hypothetical protein EOP83_34225 [Verrucomicrobiaceae bacterium]